jgi:4-hydroxy-tetrahydrodipicolinate reductase
MHRVIQWSTGNVGRQALAAILDHPQLELVGVYARGADKLGRDAGELCARGRTGIRASADVDALLALDADCVCYTPLFAEEDLLVRMLESGKNVVTSSGFIHPARARGPAFTARIEAACHKAGTSIFGSGINPGFINLLAIVLTTPCRRIESVTWDEFSYAGLYNSPESWRPFGFGLTPGERERRKAGRFTVEDAPASLDTKVFLEAVCLVADALGIELDGHEVHEDVAVATRPIEVAWTTFAPGTVAGLRHSFRGLAGGRAVVTGRVNWYMGPDLEPNWVPDRTGEEWVGRVEIEGEPRVRCELGVGPGRLEDPDLVHNVIDRALIGTAMPVVNAIPAVCAAPPGVRSYLDLPLTPAAHLLRR